MKKPVISVLIFLMVLMLSGCETAPKGNISELTDYSWQAKLDQVGKEASSAAIQQYIDDYELKSVYITS